ncbi:MAG: HEAT repeat domain-containing protein [Myxococcota bacterium]
MIPPEHSTFEGALGRTRRELVHVLEEDGGTRLQEVLVAVNVATDPELREACLDGVLHGVADEALAVPYVFHDPELPCFVLVVPGALRHRALAERAALLARLTEATDAPLPPYVEDVDLVVGARGLAAYLAAPEDEVEWEAEAEDAREADAVEELPLADEALVAFVDDGDAELDAAAVTLDREASEEAAPALAESVELLAEEAVEASDTPTTPVAPPEPEAVPNGDALAEEGALGEEDAPVEEDAYAEVPAEEDAYVEEDAFARVPAAEEDVGEVHSSLPPRPSAPPEKAAYVPEAFVGGPPTEPGLLTLDDAELVRRLREPDTRLAAALMLVARPQADLVPVVGAMREMQPDGLAALLEPVVRRGDEAVGPLIALLRAPRAVVRQAAALGLGEIGATSAAPDLARLLETESSESWREVARVLASLGEAGSRAALGELALGRLSLRRAGYFLAHLEAAFPEVASALPRDEALVREALEAAVDFRAGAAADARAASEGPAEATGPQALTRRLLGA